MYFLTNLYRYLKLAVALALFISGVCVTAYSFTFNSTGLTVLGVLQIIASLLLCGDATKVIADMKRITNDLKAHGHRLEMTVADIDKETGELRTEVDNLQDLSKTKDKQLKKAAEQIKKQLSLMDEQKNINIEDKKQLQEATEQNEKHRQENLRLTMQVDKVQRVYEQTKKVVAQMVLTEGAFKEMGRELNQGIDRLETVEDKIEKTAQVMARLHEVFSKAKFHDVDQNRDGFISKDEFHSYVGGR